VICRDMDHILSSRSRDHVLKQEAAEHLNLCRRCRTPTQLLDEADVGLASTEGLLPRIKASILEDLKLL
jgi:hypothetical protein